MPQKKEAKEKSEEISLNETPGQKKVSRLPKFGLAEEVLGSNKSEEVLESNKLDNEEQKIKGEEVKSKKGQEIDLHEEILVKYVTFFLGNEEYGLPISHVQEINRVTEITRVPNSPEHVQGVINLRGRIVPVIELKQLLQIGGTKLSKQSRIVLAEYGSKLLGFVVDSVAQVIDISPNQIDEAPEEVRRTSENFVRGIGKIENRMIILLELESVVQGKKILAAQI